MRELYKIFFEVMLATMSSALSRILRVLPTRLSRENPSGITLTGWGFFTTWISYQIQSITIRNEILWPLQKATSFDFDFTKLAYIYNDALMPESATTSLFKSARFWAIVFVATRSVSMKRFSVVAC